MSVKLQDIDILRDEKTGRIYLGYKNKRDNIKKTREITIEFSDMLRDLEGNVFCDSDDKIFTIMILNQEDLEKMKEFNEYKAKLEDELNNSESKKLIREAVVSKALEEGDAKVIGSIVNEGQNDN